MTEQIVKSRYTVGDEQSWEDVCRRVARFVSAAESLYTDDINVITEYECMLFNDLNDKLFVFNSPCLFNSGLDIDPTLLYKPLSEMKLDDYREIYKQKNKKNQLAACYYLEPKNSIESIYKTLSDAALITKGGGGVGFSFSGLSHEGRALDSGVGEASGPLSFIKLFNESANAIRQGGRRRAACLANLRVDHPDIIKFIQAKDCGNTNLSFFNISVMITDEFMKCVADDCHFDLRDPVTGERVNRIKAKELWEKIIDQAWRTGDPGLLFDESINEDGYIPGKRLNGTNPCGEEPLYENLACVLGHVNLEKFSDSVDLLVEASYRSMRYLDNMIDMSSYPIPEIDEEVRKYRPVGLGVMGFAHFLFNLKTKYGKDSLWMIDELGKRLLVGSYAGSVHLARERGHYPAYKKEDWMQKSTSKLIFKYADSLIFDNAPWLVNDLLSDSPEPVRNATFNTIAPTGTTSLICDTSSGIEPVYALSHTRVWLDEHGKENEMEVKNRLYEEAGEKGDWFVDAYSISPDERVQVQAAWQKWIDSGISSTVNLSSDAPREVIDHIYKLAWSLGCKGITVFRDGCKEVQVLKRKEEPKVSQAIPTKPQDRPKRTEGFVIEEKVSCGTLYITLCKDESGKPLEVFLNKGKSGVCGAFMEALSRMVSLALRSNIHPKYIVKQLKRIICPACVANNKVKVTSCADAVARVLLKEEIVHDSNKNKVPCPECNNDLIPTEGCFYCAECGYNKCS